MDALDADVPPYLKDAQRVGRIRPDVAPSCTHTRIETLKLRLSGEAPDLLGLCWHTPDSQDSVGHRSVNDLHLKAPRHW
jgi:hypothetical protein